MRGWGTMCVHMHGEGVGEEPCISRKERTNGAAITHILKKEN